MKTRLWPGNSVFLIAVVLGLCVHQCAAVSQSGSAGPERLVISRAEYLDRVRAIWTAQMIGQWTGLLFEHQVASVLNNTPLRPARGYAPVDDDYYYEMVAIRAFEKYGIHLTVEQLGAQWLENNAGSWGSSEQALLLLKRGVKPPNTGNPRYNKLWWTIGPQFSSDVYGTLAPGMPNVAAEMARRLTHINGFAEGTDGAVFVSGMISLGFVETDTKEIVRKAARLISPLSPYRQCLDMVITMAEAGKSAEEINRAINERWGIEYPATNNAVVNGGIVATSVWFGEGDFLKTENLAFTAADFADTDCNAANAGSVVAAMHGMSVLPAKDVAELNDRIYGATMGPLKLTPPVDESISALAERTAVIGEKILLENGASFDGGNLEIPVQQPTTQAPELFKLSDLTKWWNPDWSLERAGFGGAGGGLAGIRGDSYLDGDTLAIWPRDEVRGALLRRSVKLGARPSLTFDVGADAGRTWHLVVYVNNDKVLDRPIAGDSLAKGNTEERRWEHISVDLATYKNQPVVIRLYDLVLVPNHYAGNSYWRHIQVQ
ncbi:MAG: ADP-ribosylglycohydrolase family protein [Terracidiphilus sp.]